MLFFMCSYAAELTATDEVAIEKKVESLAAPMYTPFIERYVLDELKQLRIDVAAQRVELTKQIVDRELKASTLSLEYATDTITYFFYLIAGVSSILVMVGWTSFRDIKERVQTLADEEIEKVVGLYENRLSAIEDQLNQKTQLIDANRLEIERSQQVHSLWLRAEQEHQAESKIAIYDQILQLRPKDCEAITYKADAALELDEPRWAISLCRQALSIDEKNMHAFYQLACAYTALDEFDEAIHFLKTVVEHSDGYHDAITQDEALRALYDYPAFQELLKNTDT